MPIMRPEEMYQVGVGLGSAEMQGQQQAVSLYSHLLRNQVLANELQKQKALRDIAASVPANNEISLQSTTIPQGMTGTEEYVPAETQTQKIQIPTTMHDRLATIGEKVMGIDPEQGIKFITAAESLRKVNDPMEKAARFGKFFNEIRTLPIKAKQALLGSMAQTPEWKQLFGNADIAGAMETAEGTTVPARDDKGEIIGYHVLSPDGSKWDFKKADTEKGGIAQFKDFQKMSPEEQKAYLNFEQAKNPKHFIINPPKPDKPNESNARMLEKSVVDAEAKILSNPDAPETEAYVSFYNKNNPDYSYEKQEVPGTIWGTNSKWVKVAKTGRGTKQPEATQPKTKSLKPDGKGGFIYQ